MDYAEERQGAEIFFKECLDLLCRKAQDYAKNTDAFSNFRKIANISDVPTERSFLMFMAVKIARLAELLNKEAQVPESMEDSLKDIVNYACLMALYLKEEHR